MRHGARRRQQGSISPQHQRKVGMELAYLLPRHHGRTIRVLRRLLIQVELIAVAAEPVEQSRQDGAQLGLQRLGENGG